MGKDPELGRVWERIMGWGRDPELGKDPELGRLWEQVT